MTRNDRKLEELEREARRARRLAERAKERAGRKVDQAKIAAARAARLAERANPTHGSDQAQDDSKDDMKAGSRDRPGSRSESRRRDIDLDESIEKFVDEVTEKWTRKAEDWIDKQSQKMFNEQEDSSYQDSVNEGSVNEGSLHKGSVNKSSVNVEDEEENIEQVRASANRAKREADEADELAARAEARADAYHHSLRRRPSSRRRRKERDARRRSARELRNRERSRRASRRRHLSLRSRLFSGRGLYRDQKNKKVCGVCAGFADYLSLETWQVRVATVVGAFFMGQIVVPAYFIAYFLMDPKPYYKEVTDRFDELDDFDDDLADDFYEGNDDEVVSKMRARGKRKSQGRPGINRAQTLRRARNKFSDIEGRLRAMESHVTSPKFELQRELRKISGEA